MFFLSIIKLLFLFIFIYFLFTLFKVIFKVIGSLSSLNRNRKDAGNAKSPETSDKGSIIELKKDEYKVE
jgi:hypothetical protein